MNRFFYLIKACSKDIEMKKFNVAIFSMAAFVLSIFSSCSKEKKETFNLYNWSYYTPDSVLEKFAKEYNCKVKVDYFDSNEMMYAKLRAGAKGYDLTIPSQDYTSIMIKQGMVQKIDHSQFHNSKYINPNISNSIIKKSARTTQNENRSLVNFKLSSKKILSYSQHV